jgi:RHH-type proline utilization regulon transcriptional repressor/proline dehydrogenase/delta 1-pyrroline-5-carboxylate dehydrogenase
MEPLVELSDAIDAHPSSEDVLGADVIDRVKRAMRSYDLRHAEEFGREHDHFRLVGQDNFRRYRPVPALRVRVHPEDDAFEIFARVAAARAVGCHVIVSTPPGLRSEPVALLDELTEVWAASIEFVWETDEQLVEVIQKHQVDRVRYARPERVPIEIRKAIGDTGIYVADTPVLAEGRIELLWYITEQSISDDYHRYGNLGARVEEERRPVL